MSIIGKNCKITLEVNGESLDLSGHMHKMDYDAIKVEYRPIAVRASMPCAYVAQNETLNRYISSVLERQAEMERVAYMREIYGSWEVDTESMIDESERLAERTQREYVLSYRHYSALCHPSRNAISITVDESVDSDAIPVEECPLFSPRPEYVPEYVPEEYEQVY